MTFAPISGSDSSDEYTDRELHARTHATRHAGAGSPQGEGQKGGQREGSDAEMVGYILYGIYRHWLHSLRRHLARKETPPPRSLQQGYAEGPMVFL